MERKDLEEKLKEGKYDEVIKDGLELFDHLYVLKEEERVYLALADCGCYYCSGRLYRDLISPSVTLGEGKFTFLRGKELIFLSRDLETSPRKDGMGADKLVYQHLEQLKKDYKSPSITFVAEATGEKLEIMEI